MIINSFVKKYFFLSNFYPQVLSYEGELYKSAEHAYQAQKATNNEDKDRVRLAPTAGQSKKIAKSIQLREDWEEVKLDIMEKVLVSKFSDPSLKRALLETGDDELVEGNWWGDIFWGVYQGYGENHLGKLLMKIRENIKNGI